MLAASQKCSATFHRSHSSHHELSPTDGHPICGASLPLGQAFCHHDLGGKAHATRPRGSVWGPARTAPPGHNHSWILPLCTECEATSAPIDGRARPMGWVGGKRKSSTRAGDRSASVIKRCRTNAVPSIARLVCLLQKGVSYAG